MGYFDPRESVHAATAGYTRSVLETVAGRYVGQHPPHPFIYRAYGSRGIGRKADYRYRFDLADRHSGMAVGQVVYARAKLWSEADAELRFALNADGPARLYVNGELIYRTTLADENVPNYRAELVIRLRKGWNAFVMRFVHTAAGCGGTFGTATYKSMPLHFLIPDGERQDQEGWLYSEPLGADASQPPDASARWHPDASWTEDERRRGPFSRIFGEIGEEGEAAYAWTRIRGAEDAGGGSGTAGLRLEGTALGPLTVYADGREVLDRREAGEFSVRLPCRPEGTDLLIRAVRSASGWGFRLIGSAGEPPLEQPVPVRGAGDPWLYLGPFAPDRSERGPERDSPAERLRSVYDNGREGAFWRTDQPDTHVRVYAENPLFGKWSYPLGVTMYGLA